MPDWVLIKDRDGNRYFIDKNNRIWTSGEPEYKYKPVSFDGLDYYINHGIELIRSNYKVEGLIILKSILSMPVKNETIFKAQCRASEMINYLIKREGQRFNKLNREASLLSFIENNTATLINDYMLYSLKAFPREFKIINIKIREKNNYKYYGILIGVNLEKKKIAEKNGYKGCDLIIAIDSEKFSYPVNSIKKIEKNWRLNLGTDTFEREIFHKDDKKIIYTYKDRHSPHFSGFEGFYLKGCYGYHMRTITSRYNYEKYYNRITRIVESFTI